MEASQFQSCLIQQFNDVIKDPSSLHLYTLSSQVFSNVSLFFNSTYSLKLKQNRENYHCPCIKIIEFMKHAIFLKQLFFNWTVPDNPVKNYKLTSDIPSLLSLLHFFPIIYHHLAYDILCFLSPSSECKLHEGRNFNLFCLLLYPQYQDIAWHIECTP